MLNDFALTPPEQSDLKTGHFHRNEGKGCISQQLTKEAEVFLTVQLHFSLHTHSKTQQTHFQV